MLGRRVALVAAFMLSAAMVLTATPVRAHEGPSLDLPAPVVATVAPVASPAQPISSPAAPLSTDAASPAAPRADRPPLLAARASLRPPRPRPRCTAGHPTLPPAPR